ncbi:hypothetical protein [Thermomonospora umbrina]|uniref:Uncharacterized protein n=1 Tax=Thermomonospora umbrina TaxID=111806 RepID=A0A3D9SVU0_9ACTN|nr:hypothetical protein [Thermomonospora umbrina]REE96694.1 hypothetical protein DFJ69_2140 [Thermomonospora umbrina]
MEWYRQIEDRKIMNFRDSRVLEIKVAPAFHLRLTNGVTFDFDGTVMYTVGRRGGPPAPRPLTELPREELSSVVSTRPLSWVVFNDGAHRIAFSNAWELTLDPQEGGTWRMSLSDGEILTHPPVDVSQ